MTVASIETTLELWASSLRDVKARMRGLFTQERVAASANLFLDGLLGDERRKTGWMRAEAALRRAGKGYVLGVKSDHQFGSWGKQPVIAGKALEIAQNLTPEAWHRLSAGEGTKGARLHAWAYYELADLDAQDYDEAKSGLWTRGLLIRRNISDGDLAFFTTWCPVGTDIQTLVSVEGHRWAIEDSFKTAKNELGLDHNETRSWHGWHRHVSLVMLAFAMMAVIRYRANIPAPPKRPRMPTIQQCSDGPSRKSAASQSGLPSARSLLPMSSPGHAGEGSTKPKPDAPTSKLNRNCNARRRQLHARHADRTYLSRSACCCDRRWFRGILLDLAGRQLGYGNPRDQSACH